MSWPADGHARRVLAVIPARGGSKGVPRKNLRVVGGMSLVGRAAALAAAVPWIDRAVVSSDDAEICAEAERHGAAAPFVRPAELASDTARAEAMWRHAWLAAEAAFGDRYEISLLLEPTSPLRIEADLAATVAALVAGGHASAVTVSPIPAHFSPHKAMTVDAAGRLGFHMHNGALYSRRQAIPAPVYHRNGLCYAAMRAAVVERGEIIGDDCAAVVVDRPTANIDEEFELELAEWLLARQQRLARAAADRLSA